MPQAPWRQGKKRLWSLKKKASQIFGAKTMPGRRFKLTHSTGLLDGGGIKTTRRKRTRGSGRGGLQVQYQKCFKLTSSAKRSIMSGTVRPSSKPEMRGSITILVLGDGKRLCSFLVRARRFGTESYVIFFSGYPCCFCCSSFALLSYVPG